MSPDYLKSLKSRQDILSWRRFLQKLGVQNIIAVKKFNESVPEVKTWANILKYSVCIIYSLFYLCIYISTYL